MTADNRLFLILWGKVEERQLDGLLQQRGQQRFLLFLLAAEDFDFATAEWTELEHLSSAPPQAMNAGITKYFPAIGALMGGASLGMPGTDDTAIGQHDWRGGPVHLEFRDGDVHVGALDEQLDIPEAQGLSRHDVSFLYLPPA